ncbi:Hypothetical protein FKW44_020910 [Caligus rogercresseyi]|uniref:Uncharacterized protein n=1 Tax=Caligus rogercresseyi TaxID=217165 RepID=A0A7T8GQC9_CALRO|nr:Hypothetical protein FKW44_020910 [Caligus rogercresseyi]
MSMLGVSHTFIWRTKKVIKRRANPQGGKDKEKAISKDTKADQTFAGMILRNPSAS